MAKALAAQSQTFEQVAGIWGPGFSRKLMNAVMIMSRGDEGHGLIGKLKEMIKPLLSPGPAGAAKRAALFQGKGIPLHENMTQQEMIQWVMDIPAAAGSHPAFQSPTDREIIGGALLDWGSGSQFQTGQVFRERLKGHTSSSMAAEIARLGGDMGALAGASGQGAENLLSTKLYSFVNQFGNVLPEAITIVMKALEGLSGAANGLADTFAGWLKGKANQGAGWIAKAITYLRDIAGGVSTFPTGAVAGATAATKGLASEIGKGLLKFFAEGGATRIFDSVTLFFQEWGYKLPRLLGDAWQNLKAAAVTIVDYLGETLAYYVAILQDTIHNKFKIPFEYGVAKMSIYLDDYLDMWGDNDGRDYANELKILNKAYAEGKKPQFYSLSNLNDSGWDFTKKRSHAFQWHGLTHTRPPPKLKFGEWQATEISKEEQQLAVAREGLGLAKSFTNSFSHIGLKRYADDFLANVKVLAEWVQANWDALR
jgi:hypothetical protein